MRIAEIHHHEARLDRVKDARLAKKVAELQRRGVRKLTCTTCDTQSGLARYFVGCNAMNDSGNTCEGMSWQEVAQ